MSVSDNVPPAPPGAGSSRREFLTACGRTAALGGVLAAGGELGLTLASTPAQAASGRLSWVEAKHYEKLKYDRVRCTICPRKCRVDDRERGYCATRENRGGTYYTLVYGRVCSYALDPIEKKPLFHFLPGTTAFSLSTAGCCMECKFCQNYEISQFRPEQVKNREVTPRMVAATARKYDATSVAFTYGEPVVYFEYTYDCAVVTRKQGLHPVIITSGFIEQQPLKEWCRVVDAIKVDLKGFTEGYYHDICDSELKPVLNTLVTIKKSGVWLEVVYLVVPTLNDDVADIRRMARWMKEHLGPDVPLHFSRFFPTYKLKNLPATPVRTLERCADTASGQGLRFVYIGNVMGHPRESTRCPKCGKVLIKRTGYHIKVEGLEDGKCAFCGTSIPGVWS